MVKALGNLRLSVVWMAGGAVALGALDRTDDRPPYRQIADQLRAAIERGELHVQQILGHSDVRTTQRYTHVADAVTRDAAQRIGAALWCE